MGQIANLFGKLLLDDTGFEAEVVKSSQKAADAATRTMGQRVSAGLKKSLAVGLGAAAGATALALGYAAKGALQLQNIQADFQAQTGASADAAAAAAKTINRVAGEERTSLESVSAIAVKVHNDMGLVGPDADRMTQAIAKFARVTKQDGVAAVSAYDDITDAYNLTALDSIGIMDKLLVSQQKYGGSIVENQSALAKMAPQLKALNLGIDDGIGLLNLFAASGLDAAAGQKALNAAITKLPKGESLTQFIARLATIEDDGKRAQEAIKVFGAKAGAGLANAIKPGVSSLKEFEVSANDAAGATNKAADVIDSTMTGRVQKAFSIGTAKLREFGSSFGPALTGIASLASIGAALHLDKAFEGAFKALASSSLVQGAVHGAATELGKLYGVVSGQAIALAEIVSEKFSDVLKEAFVKISATRAGTAIGAIFGAAFGVAAHISEAIGESISGSRAVGLVKTAGGKFGSAMGKIVGSSMAFAAVATFASVVIVELLKQLDELKAQIAAQSHGIGESIAKQVTTGTLEQLKTSRAALEKGLADLAPLGFFDNSVKAQQVELDKDLAAVNAAIENQYRDLDTSVNIAAKNISKSLDQIPTHANPIRRAMVSLAGSATTNFGKVKTQSQLMADRLKANAGAIATAVHNLTDKLLGEATALINGYYDPIIAQDELRVAKDEVAADKVARAATKAGTAERHQADLTLANAQKNLDQTRANLLAAGQLTGTEQKDWLKDLQTRYKNATGAARTELGKLIAKVIELQGVDRTGIHIYVSAPPGAPHKAGGGRVSARQPYIVGEDHPGGKGELFVPDVSGVIVPHGLTTAMAGAGNGGGGDSYTTVVQGLLPVRTITDIRREREHIQDVRRLRNGLGRN